MCRWTPEVESMKERPPSSKSESNHFWFWTESVWRTREAEEVGQVIGTQDGSTKCSCVTSGLSFLVPCCRLSFQPHAACSHAFWMWVCLSCSWSPTILCVLRRAARARCHSSDHHALCSGSGTGSVCVSVPGLALLGWTCHCTRSLSSPVMSPHRGCQAVGKQRTRTSRYVETPNHVSGSQGTGRSWGLQVLSHKAQFSPATALRHIFYIHDSTSAEVPNSEEQIAQSNIKTFQASGQTWQLFTKSSSPLGAKEEAMWHYYWLLVAEEEVWVVSESRTLAQEAAGFFLTMTAVVPEP